MIHRDLKLDNILINDIAESGEYRIKIADFGLSTFGPFNHRERLYDKCGTPCYTAPEVLRGQGYTLKCDMFSLGSIMFNMITGRYLFPGANKQQVLKKNKECDLNWIYDYLAAEVSDQCRSIVLLLLNKDPGKRPTAKQALMHEFFKQDKTVLQQLLDVN